jgi:alpha-ribazole phosphatase/probable phosphoglycerate mutase
VSGVELIFETHATSEDNEHAIATGWLPGALSAVGRAQARQLGERHREDRLAAVFSSDLRRAVDTAELAFAGSGSPLERPLPRGEDLSALKRPLRTDWRLRECNYGRLNGMPVAQLDRERPRRIDTPFPDGESYRQVVHRVATFLDDLLDEWSGTQVLLIGHAATKWALQHLIDGVPLESLVLAPFAWQPGWRFRLVQQSDSTIGRTSSGGW